MIDLRCPTPKCDRVYHADDAHIGKSLKCTVCGAIIPILKPGFLMGEQTAYATPLSTKDRQKFHQQNLANRSSRTWAYLMVAVSAILFSAFYIYKIRLIASDGLRKTPQNQMSNVAAGRGQGGAIVLQPDEVSQAPADNNAPGPQTLTPIPDDDSPHTLTPIYATPAPTAQAPTTTSTARMYTIPMESGSTGKMYSIPVEDSQSHNTGQFHAEEVAHSRGTKNSTLKTHRDLGVDVAIPIYPHISLMSGPDSAATRIRTVSDRDMLALINPKPQSGWYDVIDVPLGKEGWVQENDVRVSLTTHQMNVAKFQEEYTGSNAAPSVTIINQTHRNLTLKIGKTQYAIRSESSLSISIPSGIFRYYASAPAAIPAIGEREFKRSYRYSWEFWVEPNIVAIP